MKMTSATEKRSNRLVQMVERWIDHLCEWDIVIELWSAYVLLFIFFAIFIIAVEIGNITLRYVHTCIWRLSIRTLIHLSKKTLSALTTRMKPKEKKQHNNNSKHNKNCLKQKQIHTFDSHHLRMTSVRSFVRLVALFAHIQHQHIEIAVRLLCCAAQHISIYLSDKWNK